MLRPTKLLPVWRLIVMSQSIKRKLEPIDGNPNEILDGHPRSRTSWRLTANSFEPLKGSARFDP